MQDNKVLLGPVDQTTSPFTCQAVACALVSSVRYLPSTTYDPNGIRTRVTAVKGRCPRPLDDRVTKAGQYRN
jgi:hypothetical protein